MKICFIGELGFNYIPSLASVIPYFKDFLAEFGVLDSITVPKKSSDLDEYDLVFDFYGILPKRKITPRAKTLFFGHGEGACGFGNLFHNSKYLKKSDTLIVTCSSDYEIAEMLWGRDINIITIPLPTLEKSTSEIRKDSNTFNMLSIGRIFPQKNTHLTILLAKKIARTYPDQSFSLKVIGDFGPSLRSVFTYEEKNYSNLIKKLISKNVPKNLALEHIDRCRPDEIFDYFDSSDLLLNLTLNIDENFGKINSEALKYGLPVFGTMWGGAKDTIGLQDKVFQIQTWWTYLGPSLCMKSTFNLLEEIYLNQKKYLSQKNRDRIRQKTLANFSNLSIRDSFIGQINKLISGIEAQECVTIGEKKLTDEMFLLPISDEIISGSDAEDWFNLSPFLQKYATIDLNRIKNFEAASEKFLPYRKGFDLNIDAKNSLKISPPERILLGLSNIKI